MKTKKYRFNGSRECPIVEYWYEKYNTYPAFKDQVVRMGFDFLPRILT